MWEVVGWKEGRGRKKSLKKNGGGERGEEYKGSLVIKSNRRVDLYD